MATSFYIIKNNIIFSNFSDCLPSPLSMKIRSVFWKRIIQAVINLIKKSRYWIFMLILNSNASMFMKWHCKIRIKSSRWNNSYNSRIHNTFLSKSTTEEITQWHFYRRILFSIPVHSHNQIPQYKTVTFRGLTVNSYPYMLYHTWSLNICQKFFLSRLNIIQTRASLT